MLTDSGLGQKGIQARSLDRRWLGKRHNQVSFLVMGISLSIRLMVAEDLIGQAAG